MVGCLDHLVTQAMMIMIVHMTIHLVAKEVVDVVGVHMTPKYDLNLFTKVSHYT